MLLELDMVQSIALAVVLLLIGEFLVKKIDFLSKYCIPAPVVGGLSFAILALFLRQAGIMEFAIDGTLQTLTMTMFFTSVGFSASFGLLKKGGIKVFLFLGLSVVLVVMQNIIGVSFASMFQLNPLLGMATGSVPLIGGHGTAAAFGPVIEQAGIAGANSVAVAAATFGLVAGGMIGGPVGKRLIEKHNLLAKKDDSEKSYELDSSSKEPKLLKSRSFYVGTFELLIAMGIGTIISGLLEKTGATFPPYIGAMLAGAIIRNIGDASSSFNVPKVEIDIIGGISLSLFLSMALMSLRLWELADLAIPMIAMLVAQVTMMFLFAYFVTFRVMGKDYDAAVLAAGHCGFGLGATPNGIANMNSVTEKFGPAPAAFFILPLVGSLFIDFFNSGIITAFINFF
jgi:glutamate:Na+ symporter, ESS family